MKTYMFCGKGGVGKTCSATALAVYLSQQESRTAIIDYDGGHSVKNTLGLDFNIELNTVQNVMPWLHLSVIENTRFASISEVQEKRMSLDTYLKQFPDDFGIIPLTDMVNAFFGVPTDVPALQKFVTLVKVLHYLKDNGFSNVIIDVEPTAGLERLLSNTSSTARSIRNLKNQGKISLAMLGAKWPHIAGYLKGEYIRGAETYSKRIEQTAQIIKGAVYLLVSTPEASPVNQTFEVREIIERFGGKVHGYVANNVRGEPHEAVNIRKLVSTKLPVARVNRKNELHSEGTYRRGVLIDIGHTIAKIL